MRLWISMGLKPGERPDEPLRAVLRELDPDTGSLERDLWWAGEGSLHPSAEHGEFTSGFVTPDGSLCVPTRSEVLWIDPGAGQIVRRWSHPLLYDVHSAEPRPGGGLILTCTGHDSVLEVDADGAIAAHHWLREGEFRAAYPGVRDFRDEPFDRFKPHAAHPNHAYAGPDGIWVTELVPQRFRCLVGGRSIAFPEGAPHDGRLREGLLWFTLVGGQVIAVDPDSLERVESYDLRALTDSRRMLGWCRGVEVVGDRVWVGLTQLRSSAHRELLRQALRGERGRKLPTRVVELSRSSGRIVRVWPVGNAAGGTIHGLLAVAA